MKDHCPLRTSASQIQGSKKQLGDSKPLPGESHSLGIIAGSGSVPEMVAKAHIDRGGDVFAASIAPGALGKPFAIGEVGKLFEYFHSHNVTDVVMVGGLKRPSFFGLKVDSTGALLLARVVKAKMFGDDKLLRIVAQFFEENGFKIVSATSVLSGEVTLPSGVVTLKTPSDVDYKDIALGMKAAKELGKEDLGQAVIVGSGIVVGKEDERGTDALILDHQNGILVKAMKPMQDERLDIPAIGPVTVENVAAAGLRGIAIEADKVIVVDHENVIKRANELGIFLVGV